MNYGEDIQVKIIVFILYFTGFVVHALYEAKGKNLLVRTCIKIIPTTCIAVFAWLHLPQSSGAVFICVALTLCIAADFLLNYINYAGAALFAGCHVLLCIGFVMSGKMNIAVPIIFVALILGFGLLFICCRKNMPYAGAAAVYGLVLCFMTSSSAMAGLTAFLGAAMFAVSDGLIGYRMANNNVPRWFSPLIMILYYSGLYVIALSL